MARRLTETTVKLIRDHIRTNIGSVISSIESELTEKRTSFEVPRQYFFIEQQSIYQTPAVFIVPSGIDFQKSERKPNFINANVNIQCTVVVEDKDVDLLAIKGFRYMAALQEVLDQVELVSTDGDVKIVVKVVDAAFSPVYTASDKGSTRADFRHEVSLSLEVNHWEQV